MGAKMVAVYIMDIWKPEPAMSKTVPLSRSEEVAVEMQVTDEDG